MTMRLRRRATRCWTVYRARSVTVTRDRQGQRSLRRPRDLPLVFDGQRRRGHGPRDGRAGRHEGGSVFANLVDFDTVYGHRNDVAGLRCRTWSVSTSGWVSSARALRSTDLLVMTADHGNDPTTPSTDHSREYVPLLVTRRPGCGAGLISARARPLPTSDRRSRANFGVGPLASGTSFLEEIVVDHS